MDAPTTTIIECAAGRVESLPVGVFSHIENSRRPVVVTYCLLRKSTAGRACIAGRFGAGC